MTSPVAIDSLLQTVNRLLALEGIDPQAVSDDDKVVIAVQLVGVACETTEVTSRAHIEFKEAV
jgi:hypothetical protein